MLQHLAEVATSTLNHKLSRHQLAKKLRSRHHSMVVTSIAKKEGRHIIQQSRHQMQEIKVGTSFRGRDIRCKEKRSRHHSMVATSVQKKEGRDVIKRSQHQLRRLEVAISFSSRDIISKKKEGRDVIQWSRH